MTDYPVANVDLTRVGLATKFTARLSRSIKDIARKGMLVWIGDDDSDRRLFRITDILDDGKYAVYELASL